MPQIHVVHYSEQEPIRNSWCFVCVLQEFIVKDTGSGWDLGPDLDHFSSRTRHALQYMNPNKINMELVLDLLDYLGKYTAPGQSCGFIQPSVRTWRELES